MVEDARRGKSVIREAPGFKNKISFQQIKKNENKEKWCRRESKRGNLILKDNYGS